MKTKYFYFFEKESLENHIQFYIGYVKEARKLGLPMTLLTTLTLKERFSKKNQIKKIKKKVPFFVIPVLPFIKEETACSAFFLFYLFFSRKVVVHIRKRLNYYEFFVDLKKRFNNLKFVIDIEGDAEAERDFLFKHPYKKNFYGLKSITHVIKKREIDKISFEKCDLILCPSDNFKNLLKKRHSEIKNIDKKIKVIPTGVDADIFFFKEERRSQKRSILNLQNKFVVTFCGFVRFSWQNLGRTLEIFKIIKEIKKNSFLLLIIGQRDILIAKDFINKKNIHKDDYILISVPNENIPDFLNASDLGIILRHDHLTNNIVTPGQFGEYSACGLPILTTKKISNCSNLVETSGYGIVLKNMDDDEEVINKIKKFPFDSFDNEKRKVYGQWGKKNFSNQYHGKNYVKYLKDL